MEIDLAWLLALPLLFALGWVTARFDRGQQGREIRHLPKDILDGLSAVLTNDLGRATEFLLAAARSAPDSIEIHRAVGNLYRRRGLIDRAIEVHEAALQQPTIGENDRLILSLDLGRDYLAAGLFDRAAALLESVVQLTDVEASDAESASAVTSPGANPGRLELANQARALLMEIADRTRDWSAAIRWAQEMHSHRAAFEGHNFAQLMGHFHCELALEALARDQREEARLALIQAESFDAPGPQVRIASIREQMGDAPLAAGTPESPALRACKVCGFRSRQQLWQCPGCHHWDQFTPAKA
jgi:lipopolysaccharide assembly protein B